MEIKKVDNKTITETKTVIKEYTLDNLNFQKEDIETEMATLQVKLDKVNDYLSQLKVQVK